MTRTIRASLAAATLLPALLAGSACAPLGSTNSSAILERVADGDYDVGIRYPSKRSRYVMIVDEDEESFTLTNRPAAGREAGGQEADGAGSAPDAAARPGLPQQNDRVLAPCAESAGNWYRHTPAGYVCVGQSAPGAAGG